MANVNNEEILVNNLIDIMKLMKSAKEHERSDADNLIKALMKVYGIANVKKAWESAKFRVKIAGGD